MIADPLGEAVRWLRTGGLVAYPTETVWGLAADVRSAKGVERLERWKGRGQRQPISVLVENADAADALGFELGQQARRLADAFWPGPLTLIVPCSEVLAEAAAPFAKGIAPLAEGIARKDGAVGLRCSSHPLATALARRLTREGAAPITATSLNRSGEPAARSREAARALCGEGEGEPRMLDVEAEAGGDDESTVIDTTGSKLEVLRWGALSKAALSSFLEDVIAS